MCGFFFTDNKEIEHLKKEFEKQYSSCETVRLNRIIRSLFIADSNV